MSNDPHDTGQSDNIDTIRQLLRKLEEVAAKDGERSAPPVEPHTAPMQNLAALQPRPGVPARPPAATLPEIPFRTFEVDLDDDPIEEPAWGMGRRHMGWVVAVGSFVLGLGTALALILAYDPLKLVFGPREMVRQPPVATAPAEPVAIARPANSSTPVTGPAQQSAPAVPVAEARREPSAPVAERQPPQQPASPPARETVAPPAAPTTPPERIQKPAVPPQVATPIPSKPNAPAPAAKAAGYALHVIDRLELRTGERQSFGLRIEPMPTEAEALLVVIRNVPEWLSFSKGSTIGNEIWLLPAHLASDLAVELGEGAKGSVDLKVQLARVSGQMLAEAVTIVRVVRASSAPPGTSRIAVAPSINQQMISRLLTQGELLLDTGELEAARTLLREAAEAGSVAGALKLAETYDPREVRRLGMTESSADPAQAVRWYERAQALGSAVATDRLVALGRR